MPTLRTQRITYYKSTELPTIIQIQTGVYTNPQNKITHVLYALDAHGKIWKDTKFGWRQL